MTRNQFVIEQMTLARAYTFQLLAGVPAERWFEMPPGAVSHLAWQTGHLAMAQYRMMLDRIRPATPNESQIITDTFLKAYGRGSSPKPDPTLFPSVDEILATLHRVNAAAMQQINGMTDAQLDEPVLRPHPLAQTKFEAMTWCFRHELIHAGQIGLIRRQLGLNSIW